MHRAPLRRLAPAAATLLGLAVFAAPSYAAAGGAGGEIIYNTASVTLSGFPNGATLVTVTRNGATIGTGTANVGGTAKFTGPAKQKGGALMGGAITFDAPGSSAFTAHFAGLTPSDFALGLSGTVAAEVSTIPPALPVGAAAAAMTVGADTPGNPGPVAGCAAPLASYAVTGASATTINSANANNALTITGTAAPDAKTASVLVGGTAVPAVLAGGAWTATVPAANLPEGTLKVVGQYTNATGGPFGGRTISITKDTIAPNAPTVSVPAGTYSDTKLVSLQSAEGTIHYTLDGSDATANSKTYRGPINVADTATIKAVAVDAAGNVSNMASYGYTISRPQPAAPAPVFVAPVKAPKLKLDALTISSRYALKTARKRGISMVVFAPEGAKVVRVRLMRGSKAIDQVIRKVAKDGVLTVVLPHSRKARRALRRGTYRVLVTPGTSASKLGATTTRTVRIR